MRIAVNTRFLLPGKLEGLGWYTHELLRRMVDRHPEDEFLFFFDRPFDPSFVYADNVTPVSVFPPARHPILWYIWFEWALPRALRTHKAEVFFSPDSYLSLRSTIPTVLTVHDLIPLQDPEQVPWWARDYYRYFLGRYMRRADALVAVSGYTKQVMTDLSDIPEDRIRVIYNGCRDGFQPLPEPQKQTFREAFAEGQEYFFYSGAIHPRKNIPRLIKGFDRFKAQTGAKVKLLLAGRFAWQTGEVKSTWEQAHYKADIQFLGYVSEEDNQGLMAAALALINVSLSEGFGLPVLEALYCDTPVICSNTTALPEVAGSAAILVDPLSEAALAQGMQQILEDETFRHDLIEKGRKQRTQFDWDQAAEAVYQLIIAQKRP